jgi:hypothetical protein
MVKAHAHRDRAVGEGCPRCERGRGGSLGGRDATKEGVALGVHLYPAMLDNSRAPDAPVLGEGIHVCVRAERVQQPSRALDVSEEECDGAGREPVREWECCSRRIARHVAAAACRQLARRR